MKIRPFFPACYLPFSFNLESAAAFFHQHIRASQWLGTLSFSNGSWSIPPSPPSPEISNFPRFQTQLCVWGPTKLPPRSRLQRALLLNRTAGNSIWAKNKRNTASIVREEVWHSFYVCVCVFVYTPPLPLCAHTHMVYHMSTFPWRPPSPVCVCVATSGNLLCTYQDCSCCFTEVYKGAGKPH